MKRAATAEDEEGSMRVQDQIRENGAGSIRVWDQIAEIGGESG